MNFEEEDYIRVYTRDTATWNALGWDGQCVLLQTMRKVGRRTGEFEVGTLDPVEALAFALRAPVKTVRVGLERMVSLGVAVVADGKIVLPKFIRAQWARRTDAARKRESRDSQRVREDDTDRIIGQIVGSVTTGHTESQPVTLQSNPTNPNQGDPPVVPLAGDVFEFWKQARKKPRAKFDRKRRKRIEARLREGFTPEQLKAAISNARNDPFLMGENENCRVYDGIETLLRDAAQVERLLALVRPRHGASSNVPFHEPFRERPAAEPAASPAEALAAIQRATAGIGRRITG